MTEKPHDEKIRKRLTDWDPAERFGPPRPEALLRTRRAIWTGLEAPSPARVSATRLAWAMAAVALVTAFITWRMMIGIEPAADSRIRLAGDTGIPERTIPVRMQLRASNGTRIYWTVHPVNRENRPAPAKGEDHEDL